MKTITHRVNITDGLHVFKQTNSTRWHARFRIEGEWYSRATKEKDEQKVTTKAIELHTEYKILISNNLPVHTIRKSKKSIFNTIATFAIERMNNALQNNIGRVIFSDYIQAINKYFIPYFGEMQIREAINREVLLDFDMWRTKKLRRTPAKSTVLNHNSALMRSI